MSLNPQPGCCPRRDTLDQTIREAHSALSAHFKTLDPKASGLHLRHALISVSMQPQCRNEGRLLYRPWHLLAAKSVLDGSKH